MNTQLIIRNRQAGKTTEAIRMAHEKNLYIVVSTKNEAGMVRDMAREMGLAIPFPITFEEFIEARKTRGKFIRGYIIDNAERLVQYLAQEIPVYAMTITDEEKALSLGYLSREAENILRVLRDDAEYCDNYYSIESKTNLDTKTVRRAVQELKDAEMLKFYRGLMTEDGEVAGSGWCRSSKGSKYVEEYQL